MGKKLRIVSRLPSLSDPKLILSTTLKSIGELICSNLSEHWKEGINKIVFSPTFIEF